MEISDEDKKEIIEEAGKRLIWDMLDKSREYANMGSYARQIIRKQENCNLLRIAPSKDLRIKYGLSFSGGYTDFVWWVLEEIEKGNITIKPDVQPES